MSVHAGLWGPSQTEFTAGERGRRPLPREHPVILDPQLQVTPPPQPQDSKCPGHGHGTLWGGGACSWALHFVPWLVTPPSVDLLPPCRFESQSQMFLSLHKLMVLVVRRSFCIHGARQSCLQVKMIYLFKCSLSPFSFLRPLGGMNGSVLPRGADAGVPFCLQRGQMCSLPARTLPGSLKPC